MKTTNGNKWISVLSLLLLSFFSTFIAIPVLMFSMGIPSSIHDNLDLEGNDTAFILFGYFIFIPMILFIAFAVYWIFFKFTLASHSFLCNLFKINQTKETTSLLIIVAGLILNSLIFENLFLLTGYLILMLPFIIIQLWGLKKSANFLVKELRLY
jgi:hypothetical protein